MSLGARERTTLTQRPTQNAVVIHISHGDLGLHFAHHQREPGESLSIFGVHDINKSQRSANNDFEATVTVLTKMKRQHNSISKQANREQSQEANQVDNGRRSVYEGTEIRFVSRQVELLIPLDLTG